MKNTICITILLGLFFAGNLNASKKHAIHENHIAVFAGAATNFELEHTDFSLGLDYERLLPIMKHSVGIGAFGEIVFAEHKEYLAGIPVFIHPYKGLKFWVAPGLAIAEHAVHETTDGDGHLTDRKKSILLSEEAEETETETHFLFRIGAGYDIHLGKMSLTPTVNADIIDGHTVLVYGLSLGFGF